MASKEYEIIEMETIVDVHVAMKNENNNNDLFKLPSNYASNQASFHITQMSPKKHELIEMKEIKKDIFVTLEDDDDDLFKTPPNSPFKQSLSQAIQIASKDHEMIEMEEIKKDIYVTIEEDEDDLFQTPTNSALKQPFSQSTKIAPKEYEMIEMEEIKPKNVAKPEDLFLTPMNHTNFVPKPSLLQTRQNARKVYEEMIEMEEFKQEDGEEIFMTPMKPSDLIPKPIFLREGSHNSHCDAYTSAGVKAEEHLNRQGVKRLDFLNAELLDLYREQGKIWNINPCGNNDLDIWFKLLTVPFVFGMHYTQEELVSALGTNYKQILWPSQDQSVEVSLETTQNQSAETSLAPTKHATTGQIIILALEVGVLWGTILGWIFL